MLYKIAVQDVACNSPLSVPSASRSPCLPYQYYGDEQGQSIGTSISDPRVPGIARHDLQIPRFPKDQETTNPLPLVPGPRG